ncbi:hypothetical protein PGTUg99_017548 [Puccinia graminis f. sp. tritici]|uniref:Uncharacterized protein n=1 Tax=Puccinia graminis f. sp. tritici TaxID=56615 RepID=A0A5B0S0R3_PUCGR|nr:hypothetical protein PGTUg99_017548 [Puccinia graminis f. sp. tritici]
MVDPLRADPRRPVKCRTSGAKASFYGTGTAAVCQFCKCTRGAATRVRMDCGHQSLSTVPCKATTT